jgi:hypothetical protein
MSVHPGCPRETGAVGTNQLPSFTSDEQPPQTSQLVHAHKIRNRVAHSGGNASRDFNAILGNLGVPAGSRQGLSVGRLLMDYPNTAHTNDRWFFRLIGAYRSLVNDFERYFHAEIPP